MSSVESIDVEKVRKYNEELKGLREQSSRLVVQIEMSSNELKTLCAELSAELGIEVNETNIEEVYESELSKLNMALNTGTAVLEKIKNDTSGVTVGGAVQPQHVASQQRVAVASNPVQQTVGSAMVQAQPQMQTAQQVMQTPQQQIQTQPAASQPQVQPQIQTPPMMGQQVQQMQTAQSVAQTQQSSTGTMFMPTMPVFVSNGTPSNNAGNSNNSHNSQPSFFGAASPIGGVNNMGDIMQQMLKESSSDAQMLDF